MPKINRIENKVKKFDSLELPKESNNNPFHTSRRWIKFRKMLFKRNPFCSVHEGEGLGGRKGHFDHVIPISQGGAKLDERNIIGLCSVVHARKTNMEQAGKIKIKGIGEYGNLIPAPGEVERLIKLLKDQEEDYLW